MAERTANEAKPDPELGMVEVRRARLSDYPAIAVFLREAYEDLAPFKGEERWRWQFTNNPYGDHSDEYAPVWIADDAGRVVGQIAVQQGSLQIEGEVHSAGWIVDVIILPSHRGLGLGHRLHAAVAADLPLLVTLTMALATRRMAERLDAIALGTVRLYSRWVRFDADTVRRYLLMRTIYHSRVNAVARLLCHYFMIHHIIAGLSNIALFLRDRLASPPAPRTRTRIVETSRFGSEIDDLWRRIRPDFRVAFNRDSKFLNWRFFDCPQLRYACFVAWRGGVVVGYLILRQTEPVELPQGIIVDLCASRRDEATIEDLVAFAIEWCGRRVTCLQCATSIPEFVSVLRRFGFHAIRTERPTCVVRAPDLRDRLARLSKDWLLSKADHDWDQIHLA